MKVSLVQAPCWSVYTPAYAVALLTGNLRSHGFGVFPHCFDVDFYRAVSRKEQNLWLHENAAFWNSAKKVGQMISDYGTVLDGLVDRILADEPDVVGFSVKLWSEQFSLDMARRIKLRRPEAYVILGGPQMSEHKPPEFFQRYAQVDAICRQEADESLPQFLKALEQGGGRPQGEPGFAYRDPVTGEAVDCGLIKKVPDVKNIPFADYTSFDLGDYQLDKRSVTMILSRGCINRCTYCSEAPAFLRYRYYPPERVLEEMLHHWNTANVSRPMRVYLNDSLINGNMKQLVRLAELLIENKDKLQVEYGGMMFIRDELMDDEVVDKLVASGLKDTLFGMESGSEKVLQQMRKRYKHSTAEVVFKKFHDRKVTVVATGIFGYPVESEAEFYKSLNFMRRNAHNIDVFLLNYLGLWGDCDLTRDPEKYGIENGEMDHLTPNDWVADGGRNTFDVRLNRVNIARALLGDKVNDIGGFVLDQSQLYDPTSAYKQRIRDLEARVADLHRQMAEFVRIRRFVHVEEGREPIGWVDHLARYPKGWMAKGWARDPQRIEPAREVILVDERERVVSLGRVMLPRRDVEAAFGTDAMRRSGWEAAIYPAHLEEGQVLRAYVYLAEEETAYQLHGQICVPAA